MDILESALDEDDPHHIMCALPTGFGKSMPMLMLGHLLPPSAVCLISDWDALYIWTGSITLIVVPLIPIEIQLLEDCQRLGLTALAGSQLWNTFKWPPPHPEVKWKSKTVLKCGGDISFDLVITLPTGLNGRSCPSVLKFLSATLSFWLPRRWSKALINRVLL